MAIQPIRKHVTPEIPDKLYFRIGDVARLCEVPAYVLRFWETEFPQLRPNKGGTGQRLYRKRDVEMALRIKSLLYDQGYTIPGARQVFKAEVKARETPDFVPVPSPARLAAGTEPLPAETPIVSGSSHAALPPASLRKLRAVREELQHLLVLLAQPVGTPAPLPEAASARPRLQPIRPRLVGDPRPVANAAPPLVMRLVRDPRLQGDLFPSE